MTKDYFLNRANNIHNNKFQYNLPEKFSRKDLIEIICPIHGSFITSAGNHLNGYDCLKCALEKRNSPLKLNTEEFIKRAKKLHNNRCDYSKVNYKNNNTPIEIICKTHGSFLQLPSVHLRGAGCPKCSGNKRTQEDFIRDSKILHENKYDYSLVSYKGLKEPVDIICPIHGIFKQKPREHLQGNGCPECGGTRKSNTEEFIEKAKKIFPEYDYSKVFYKNNRTKIEIICKKHGSFFIKPNDLLNNHGCPICNESSGERIIRKYLEENKIEFVTQKIFHNLFYKDSSHPLKFDFYLPQYNLCIEYQGEQHYKPIDAFGGLESFIKGQERDNMKREFCKKNNINLLEIKYNQNIKEELNRKIALN